MYPVNLTIDICCSVIMAILVGYQVTQNRLKSNRLNLSFLMVCVFNLLMLLGDMPNWSCEGKTSLPAVIALYTGTTVYFAASALLLLFFTSYIMEFPAQKVEGMGVLWRLSVLLAAVQIACSVLSPFTGWYFFITEQNIYQRGSLFYLSQAIPLSLYLIDIRVIAAARRQLRKKEILFLLSYVILPIAAEAIQIANYGIALVNAAATFATLLIFVNIQWDRELMMQAREKELAQARIDIMISQIQPHFLYNTLTTIRQLCDIDPKLAKESIRDFAYFLRGNMDSLTNKAPIPFEQELVHAEHYLKLEEQRFVGRLSVKTDTPVTHFSIPPLTLQPLVENAVRHGIMMRDEGGTLTIRTEETKDACIVTVSDDGVGFVPGTLSVDGSSHIGIRNVRERLQTMCGGTLKITSIPGKGTTATIVIPKEGEL